MIKVIKEALVTWNGQDAIEQLVDNDELQGFSPCLMCCYRDYEYNPDIMATCCEVHGCGANSKHYFIIKPIVQQDESEDSISWLCPYCTHYVDGDCSGEPNSCEDYDTQETFPEMFY